MIAHFNDFCLWVYVLVDDMCKELEVQLRRPGPEPECSDGELIAICLIGLSAWDGIVETELPRPVTMQAISHYTIPWFQVLAIWSRAASIGRRRNLMRIIRL